MLDAGNYFQSTLPGAWRSNSQTVRLSTYFTLPVRAALTPSVYLPPVPAALPGGRGSLASHSGSIARLGIQTFRVPESLLAFSLLSAAGLDCMGIDGQCSVSFLMSRPAAELLSVFPLSNHRAYISPSLSACSPSPQRENQFIRCSRGPDEVCRDDGMSLYLASNTNRQ